MFYLTVNSFLASVKETNLSRVSQDLVKDLGGRLLSAIVLFPVITVGATDNATVE